MGGSQSSWSSLRLQRKYPAIHDLVQDPAGLVGMSVKTYKIKSRSRPNIEHTVTDFQTFWECTCEQWEHRRKCRHIETIKMRIGITYEPIKGRCEYCNCRQAVDPHHLYKRSTHPHMITDPKNIAFLCRICHNLTEQSQWFLLRLQRLLYGRTISACSARTNQTSEDR